jgi:hypothetical protein
MLTIMKIVVTNHMNDKKAPTPMVGRMVGYDIALEELRLRQDRKRMAPWYTMVKADTGGAKEKENWDVLFAMQNTTVLSAMDIPVRVKILSERAWSARDSAILVGCNLVCPPMCSTYLLRIDAMAVRSMLAQFPQQPC